MISILYKIEKDGQNGWKENFNRILESMNKNQMNKLELEDIIFKINLFGWIQQKSGLVKLSLEDIKIEAQMK